MPIFDNLKSAASVLQEAGKIEQYRQILEAQKELLDMQKKIMDLEIENRDLRNQIIQKKNLTHVNEVYYGENDGDRQKPFCAKCYDAEGKLIHMTAWHNARMKCPNCEGTYRS